MQNGLYFTRSVKKRCEVKDTDTCHEILPHKLFLGNLEAAEDKALLQSLGVTHIVNLCDSKSHFKKSFVYLNCPVADGDESIAKHFKTIADFIERSKTVFVHCQMGVSRSATVVIAYFMQKQNMSKQEATDFVRSKRVVIKPNMMFDVQLGLLEETLQLEEGIKNKRNRIK